MSVEDLDRLIERFNGGDVSAAEEVFRTYEPYLRMLVRRQLRPALRGKFDSMDVVQSVWADVLEGLQNERWRFADRDKLQAFLTRLARNRFLDRCRKYQKAVKRETALDESPTAESLVAGDPRASQIAQRDEIWDRMLKLCPPAHHDLLRYKRLGLSIVEIAARTGLHEGSVRRILYELAKRYAETGDSAERADQTASRPTADQAI